jgi:nucleoside 2-deoxyribosyltransferase
MKIYLAGPDIFRPDVEGWAASSRELCRRYGFEALLPIDHGETLPERIFQANLDMIRKAQVVAANLDPFRGAEPDSGTAFELGYALALGKKICAYVTRLDTLARRVETAEGRSIPPAPNTGRLNDRLGMWIEDFGLPCNLMLAVPTHIVEGGLEACLQSIRARPATA